MAIVVQKYLDGLIHLKPYHRFGRLEHSVDTLIEDTSVTKVHVIIEWLGNKWIIRDQSKNGTWLNGKKLVYGENAVLNPGDIFSLCNSKDIEYKVESTEPPQNILVPESLDEKKVTFIPLTSYNLLPDIETAEIALYSNDLGTKWYLERINDSAISVPVLTENQIRFCGKNWILKLVNQTNETDILQKMYIRDCHFHFDVSLDEESVHVTVQLNNQTIDLKTRSYHYLIVHLAREKANDLKSGHIPEAQGWVDVELLSKQLGINRNHINIFIHRARKQFSDKVSQVINIDSVFERQGQKIRFGGKSYSIYKGGEQEITYSL